MSSGSRKGRCFICKEEGHWANQCRNSNKNSNGYTNPPPILCRCRAGVCSVFISKSKKNPGRLYYCCNLRHQENDCGFFKRCDEVKGSFSAAKDSLGSTPKHSTDENELNEMKNRPMCGCKAGPCQILTSKEEETMGCKFYACPIKKGQGSCGYLKWLDERDSSTKQISAGMKSSPENSKDRKVSPSHCFNCGLEGHWKNECPSTKGNFGNEKLVQNESISTENSSSEKYDLKHTKTTFVFDKEDQQSSESDSTSLESERDKIFKLDKEYQWTSRSVFMSPELENDKTFESGKEDQWTSETAFTRQELENDKTSKSDSSSQQSFSANKEAEDGKASSMCSIKYPYVQVDPSTAQKLKDNYPSMSKDFKSEKFVPSFSFNIENDNNGTERCSSKGLKSNCSSMGNIFENGKFGRTLSSDIKNESSKTKRCSSKKRKLGHIKASFKSGTTYQELEKDKKCKFDIKDYWPEQSSLAREKQEYAKTSSNYGIGDDCANVYPSTAYKEAKTSKFRLPSAVVVWFSLYMALILGMIVSDFFFSPFLL